MSKIADLGKDYKNLPELLAAYQDDLEEADKRLDIKGKKLEISISENSAWMHYYDQRKAEINTLVKYFKSEEDRVRSVLFRSYKENYSRALGEREINKYLDSEEAYIFVHSLLLEVEEVYELYQATVKAFVDRNYLLTNITKLRVASLENIEI